MTNPLVPESLSCTLRELDMGYKFNHQILENVLSLSLIVLKLCNGFDQPLYPDTLPEKLEYLEMGNYTHLCRGFTGAN